MAINSRDEFIDYIKRDLGDPVIEINVEEQQLDDRIDEALAYWREYHSDAVHRTYIKHQLTAEDITNKFVTVPSDTLHVVRMFSPGSSTTSSRNFFDIKYQMHLNDIADLHSYIGDLGYYEQMQQYLSLLDMQLTGTPQVNFVRRQYRLYIRGEIEDKDLLEGDYIILEAYAYIDENTFSSIWNDIWLKEYAVALVKRQWGTNLMKFDGMQLPGGVQINGRQIYEDAMQEIEKLRERIRLEHELPADFFVG
ncbi:MAG TPA: hypothetical protein DCW83_04935 [Saprospirales bacterium]|jgi:hypothetical protein|nr:hypothetical protein [Saprospirales bacterium]